MSILGKIFAKILPGAHAAPSAAASQARAPQSPPPQQPNGGPSTPAAAATQPRAPQATAAAAAPAAAPVTAAQAVDIEQVLDGMAANNPQKLNWRSSIVDLMKLVGMESSLQERKELADELGYSGDPTLEPSPFFTSMHGYRTLQGARH